MNVAKLPLRSRILLWIMSIGVVFFWMYIAFFRPHTIHEFSTVTGKIISAEENFTMTKIGRAVWLDIFLEGSSICYRVPVDGYLDYFRRNAFFSEVTNGSIVQVTALTEEIKSPSHPLLDTTTIVFVRGVRVGNRDYCKVDDYIAWQKSNFWWEVGIAVFVTAFLAVIFFESCRRSENALAKQEEAVSTPPARKS